MASWGHHPSDFNGVCRLLESRVHRDHRETLVTRHQAFVRRGSQVAGKEYQRLQTRQDRARNLFWKEGLSVHSELYTTTDTFFVKTEFIVLGVVRVGCCFGSYPCQNASQSNFTLLRDKMSTFLIYPLSSYSLV